MCQYLRGMREGAAGVEYEHEVQFANFKQEHEKVVASMKGVKISCCANITAMVEQKRRNKKKIEVKKMQKSSQKLKEEDEVDEVMEDEEFVEELNQPEFEFFQLNDVMKPENFLD